MNLAERLPEEGSGDTHSLAKDRALLDYLKRDDLRGLLSRDDQEIIRAFVFSVPPEDTPPDASWRRLASLSFLLPLRASFWEYFAMGQGSPETVIRGERAFQFFREKKSPALHQVALDCRESPSVHFDEQNASRIAPRDLITRSHISPSKEVLLKLAISAQESSERMLSDLAELCSMRREDTGLFGALKALLLSPRRLQEEGREGSPPVLTQLYLLGAMQEALREIEQAIQSCLSPSSLRHVPIRGKYESLEEKTSVPKINRDLEQALSQVRKNLAFLTHNQQSFSALLKDFYPRTATAPSPDR